MREGGAQRPKTHANTIKLIVVELMIILLRPHRLGICEGTAVFYCGISDG
jgi:hypothetical protein